MLKDQIAAFLKEQAVEPDDFKIGTRFAHVLVRMGDLTAVPYDGEDGIASLLEYMERNEWMGIYENDDIIGVRKGMATVLLLAGGQLELQIEKTDNLQQIDKAYLDFLQGIMAELEARKQILLAVGYQPVTKAEDIALVPMAKHQLMDEFLADHPTGRQLEKAAAPMTVTIDYAHSDDFEKKYRVATALAPAFAALFDNTAMWGGEEYTGFCGTTKLRNESNKKITYVPGVLTDGNYKFNQSADTITKMPAVAVAQGEEIVSAGDKTNEEVFGDRDVTTDEIIGMLNMCQADVRATEQGIELRMVDSLPYPLNMAFIALVKGLFYNPEQLDAALEYAGNFKQFDIDAIKLAIVENGMEAKYGEGAIADLVKDLLFMATPFLPQFEQHYLQPLDAVIFKGITPKKVTTRQLKSMMN